MGKLAQLLSGLKSVGDYQSERAAKLSDLKNTEQTQRRNDLAIEQGELTIEDMRRKMDEAQKTIEQSTQRKAKRDAIMQAGGGVKELVGAGLMDEALALQTHQAGLAKTQADTDKLAIDNATGSVAPPVSLPGEVYPPMPGAQPGAPLTQAPTKFGMEQGTIPVQTSQGQRLVPSAQGQEQADALKNRMETDEAIRLEKAQVFASPAPPAERNIDPNSPEGIAARLEFDNKRYKPPVAAPAPRNIDPLSPEGIAARLSVPTADARNRATAMGKIDPVLQSINALSEKINTGEGLTAKAVGEIEKAKARANYNDDVAEYNAIIAGFTPMVARAVGHSGVLTQQDVDSVKELFPKPGDSKTLRDRKTERVRFILSGGMAAGGEVAAGDAPEGVDQLDWDAMTPDEKALWQN